MSTASAYLTVRGIDIDVVYKDIKHLHIGVYPPLGRVRVAAPVKLDDDRVRLAVIARLPWITKQRNRLRSAERQSTREMTTGGVALRLGPTPEAQGDQATRPRASGGRRRRLLLYVPEGATTDRCREILDHWYRDQLRTAIPDLIAKWSIPMDVVVPRWSIRRMKTKWGSCNRETGHIWFNVELGKKHPDSLEYLVVHEMTHLLERNHGERFTTLMDRHLPDWRSRRDQLNDAPLADEWGDLGVVTG